LDQRPKRRTGPQSHEGHLRPAWSKGEGCWSRPELRLFVTHARWNAAANDAAGAGGLAGLGDNKTSGTSVGVQLETWW